MKPCSKNRKQLALLAVDALNATEQRELRAHLKTCEGCRSYLHEISNVTQKLSAVETRSHLQTSPEFHQRVTRSLRAQETPSTWVLLGQVRRALSNWRIALPLAAATAGVVALLLFARQPTTPVRNIAQANPPTVKTDLDPTISNYQMVANRSLEKLDELLNRQANHNHSHTPIYTASMTTRLESMD